MLLVFDLDDTLIDTSGSVTPIKIKIVLDKMVQKGLPIQDIDKAYQKLLHINKRSLSSKNTFCEFLENDPSYLQFAMQEMSAMLPEHVIVEPMKGVVSILLKLFSKHHLCLVTAGSKEYQYQKLKKAGIDTSFFSKIIVTSDVGKKESYRKLLQGFNVTPSEVVVCGDRICVDLLPAKELGFTTIQMLWGRGEIIEGDKDYVDYRINNFISIPKVIEKIIKRTS